MNLKKTGHAADATGLEGNLVIYFSGFGAGFAGFLAGVDFDLVFFFGAEDLV